MAIGMDAILNRFVVLAPQFSGDDNAHNGSRGAGVLGGPGITSEMKPLAWKSPKHGLAQETKEAGKAIATTYYNRHSAFLPSFSFHSREIRARGFSGGDWRFFPVFLFLEIALDPAIGAASEISRHVSLCTCKGLWVRCCVYDAVTSFRVLFPREKLWRCQICWHYGRFLVVKLQAFCMYSKALAHTNAQSDYFFSIKI